METLPISRFLALVLHRQVEGEHLGTRPSLSNEHSACLASVGACVAEKEKGNVKGPLLFAGFHRGRFCCEHSRFFFNIPGERELDYS